MTPRRGPRATDAVGAFGERVAVRYLLGIGLTLIERNWRCPAGELDIIARDGSTIVFVEVKTRRGQMFGTPAEAVVGQKVSRVRRLAALWLARQPGPQFLAVRFDVVSVLVQRRGPAQVEHLRDAF
jgi:putative endonuclease